mgnify:CR=1 FL=1
MYLHTILSGLLHIMKTTPHIMRHFKKSPYKTVAAFHTLAIMYNILIKKVTLLYSDFGLSNEIP